MQILRQYYKDAGERSPICVFDEEAQQQHVKGRHAKLSDRCCSLASVSCNLLKCSCIHVCWLHETFKNGARRLPFVSPLNLQQTIQRQVLAHFIKRWHKCTCYFSLCVKQNNLKVLLRWVVWYQWSTLQHSACLVNFPSLFVDLAILPIIVGSYRKHTRKNKRKTYFFIWFKAFKRSDRSLFSQYWICYHSHVPQKGSYSSGNVLSHVDDFIICTLSFPWYTFTIGKSQYSL